MKITRYIHSIIKRDLQVKMVFIGGPRQVGKTTLAKTFIQNKKQYFSWDDLDDRQLIKNHMVDPNLKIVVLDEIHKYTRWRMLVKGLYDKYCEELRILVTGSARLDHFRKGGDSLVGRYHYFRLHPFTLPEIDKNFQASTVLDLLKFGGFPEPFTNKSESIARRWRQERLSRVVYQDIKDLSTIKDLSKLELLVDALPSRVGSLFSANNLKEDLETSVNTIQNWIKTLEVVYYCYSVFPYGPAKIRAVKKTPKVYLWDWAEVPDVGPRFENMVAGHLLKYCHFLEDTEGFKMELRYIRDIDGREIDFVVMKDKKPVFAVECKTGEDSISKHIRYYAERTPIPHYYQVHLGEKSYKDKNIDVLPFEEFCKKLKLV